MAEGARLESVCRSKAYRGFESLSLRRIIPSMENRLLFFLNDNDKTPEQYIDSMVKLEKKIEKDMIEVFNKIGFDDKD